MSIAVKTRSRAQQGEDTRRRILELAMDVASKKGLGAVSIGDLANELEMSKSGLFAHFGSKEELQLATIQAAEAVFAGKIVTPSSEAAAGLPRLQALLENHLRYLECCVFSGGCFFSATAAEFDDQPGRVRDRLAASMRAWRDLLRREIRHAQEAGDIGQAVDAAQLGFELDALMRQANYARRLMGDPQAFAQARTGIEQRLRSVTTKKRGHVGVKRARG